MRTFERPLLIRPRAEHSLALVLTVFLAAPVAVRNAQAQAQQQFDGTQMVVMGEGLAAGFADFGLHDVYQRKSFPALMAQQMKVLFPQPLIQPPGLGSVPGFYARPALVPATLQTTVRVAAGPKPIRKGGQPPPNLFVFNASIPSQKVSDALNRKPVHPMIQVNDMQQTTINLILGFPGMVIGRDKPLWTQLEYVQQLRPTFVILSLGYSDVLDAAAAGDPSLLPDVARFRSDYSSIVEGLRRTFAPIVVVNVPDPVDTAYFTSVASASRLLVAPAATLTSLYGLRSDDLITIPGLVEIGNQLKTAKVAPLPRNAIVSGANAAAIRARVRALNTEIASLAQSANAPVYDVAATFARLRASGLQVGARLLTADFQGGIYSLCGFYPGQTGQAVIANDMLNLVNRTFSTQFPLIDLTTIVGADPAVRFMPLRRAPRPDDPVQPREEVR